MFGAFLDAAMSIPRNMQMEEDRNQRQDVQWHMQWDTQNFNSAQAAAQRDWATQMSNTQYQRAATDASAAGLNRILAMRQGGAGVPAGSAAAAGQGSAPGGNPGTASSSFALAQNLEAQNENIEMDTRKKDAERNYTSQLWNTSRAQEGLLNEQTATQRELTARTRAEAATATASALGAANEGEIDETTAGSILRWINRISESIQGASSAARRAKPH